MSEDQRAAPPSAHPTTTRDAARAYLAAGLSVVSIKPDGTKAPHKGRAWKPLQEHAMNTAAVDRWFGDGDGVAIIGGAVSGNLEILDFDRPGLFDEWLNTLEAAAPELASLVRNGGIPTVTTPSGGSHIYYRAPVIEGNHKLAEDERLNPGTGKVERKTLIETRGRGGYCVCPPSPPACHPSGKPYIMLNGDLLNIPTITDEERETLLNVARSYNRLPKREDSPVSSRRGGDEDDRPGDAYNKAGEWRPLLEAAGWVHVRSRGDDASEWRRPGKETEGISATTGYCRKQDGTPLLYVFSSNAAPFEPFRAYSPFTAFALLRHGGDFATAARNLRVRGYGENGRPRIPVGVKPMPETHEDMALPETMTELGNALRFVRLCHDRVRLAENWKKWLLWDGARWMPDPAFKIVGLFIDVVLKELIGMEAGLRKRAAELRGRSKSL